MSPILVLNSSVLDWKPNFGITHLSHSHTPRMVLFPVLGSHSSLTSVTSVGMSEQHECQKFRTESLNNITVVFKFEYLSYKEEQRKRYCTEHDLGKDFLPSIQYLLSSATCQAARIPDISLIDFLDNSVSPWIHIKHKNIRRPRI